MRSVTQISTKMTMPRSSSPIFPLSCQNNVNLIKRVVHVVDSETLHVHRNVDAIVSRARRRAAGSRERNERRAVSEIPIGRTNGV